MVPLDLYLRLKTYRHITIFFIVPEAEICIYIAMVDNEYNGIKSSNKY